MKSSHQENIALSSTKKKHFRSLGHTLHPIVTVAGNGLTDNLMAELERALEDHELIKVKVSVEDRQERKALIQSFCKSCRAELVQEVGKIALIYRPAKKPDAKKSNIR